MHNHSEFTRSKLRAEIRRLELLLQQSEEPPAPDSLAGRPEPRPFQAEPEGHYAGLYHLAPIGFCTLDEAGTIHEINAAAAELLGHPPDLLRGRPLASMTRGFTYIDLWEHLGRCRERDGKTTTQLSFERQGRHYQIALVSVPVVAPGLPAPLFHTALIDLTSEKLAQERLWLLSSLGQRLAAANDAQAAVEASARLLVPSLGDCAVVLLEPAAGGRAFAVVHDRAQDQRRLASEVEARRLPPELAALAGGVHRGASMFPAQGPLTGWMFGPERKAGGAVLASIQGRSRTLGFLLLGTAWTRRPLEQDDLSLCQEVGHRLGQTVEQLHLYQQAVHDLREREEYVAIVSHDLVNAAASIKLSAEVVQGVSRAAGPPKVRTAIARILGAAEWISSLVRKVLDVAQLESGVLPMDCEPVPAAGLPAEAVEVLAAAAGERQVAIRVDIPRTAWVMADRGRITQVFLNLIGNAVKYSPPGGEVRVAAGLHGDQVHFSVSDRGPGIAPADQPRVFDRYWQARRQRRAGVGLGLAIARAIVVAHGGNVWVESTPGQGTTFWFSLEAVRPPGGTGPETMEESA
jgi:PAS domain S-box-containing protein